MRQASTIVGETVGARLDNLLYELGRSVRRLVGGGDAPSGAAEPRPQDLDPGRLPDASAARRSNAVEPTDDGRFRTNGYVFATERQARQYAQRPGFPGGAAAAAAAASSPSPPSPPPRDRSAPLVSTESLGALSASDRELMTAYGITAADGGGFSARGFVFNTLDQAVSWAGRSGRRAAAEPRLPITAGDRFRWPVREPLAPPPAPPPASRAHPTAASASAPARKTGKPRWIGSPTPMEIGGVSLVAELIYVGKAQRHAYPRNNSLIDPDLAVASYGDPQGTTLSYWGSYEDLQAPARRTYLEWLAGGRRDPATPMGYVFIFFYGLEWRLLYEKSRDETSAIAAEVRRLLEIYGENGSFRGYAERFLDVAVLLADRAAEPLEPSPAMVRHWEMPLRVKAYLGSFLAEGKPLHAEAALLWVLSAPETSLRTAGVRCFDELRELWSVRFSEVHPAGLAVRRPKACISQFYRAASAQFTIDVTIGELPDIGNVSAPLGRLRALLEACTEELDPLSRLLGRQPDARGTIAAAAVAPKPLLTGRLGEGLRACAEDLARRVGDQATRRVPVQEVCASLDVTLSKNEGKVPAATLRTVAALLDSVGFGFEPDRRYGCTLPVNSRSNLVLFVAAGGARIDPERPAYDAARTMIEIAALAALADGEAVPVELQSIHRDLVSLPDLDPVERKRLMAHAEALLADPPKRKEAVSRLVALPIGERRRVMQCAVSAVLADGRVLPAEVRFLEHLHTALGLPQEDVYAALHRGGTVEDDRTVVGQAGAGGVPASAAEAVRIDAARLARIRGETTAVSALLAGIFVEETEEAQTAVATIVAGAARFEGLDTAHGELLWALVQRPMPWDAFEEQARGAKLLPAGAIETINEWGFEVLGEPVVEEEDPVAVAGHLVEQVTALAAAA